MTAPTDPRDEESVDLTPGVVWTEAQLAVVRDLLARAVRAETQAEARAVARAQEELRAAADTYDEAWPGIDPLTIDLRNRAAALGQS